MQTTNAIQKCQEIAAKQKQQFLDIFASTKSLDTALSSVKASRNMMLYKIQNETLNSRRNLKKLDEILSTIQTDQDSTSECSCGRKFKDYRALRQHGRRCSLFTIPETISVRDVEKIENLTDTSN